MVGQRLGQFEIVEQLGEGGMGVVYKARDERLDRLVAIKLLRPDAIFGPETRARFLQEARAASALSHPNIITVYEIDRTMTDHFIVMEYVRGETLEARLKREPLGVEDSLRLGLQIASALGAAHAAGITHRDLKPANIMVTAEGLVKVMDFGLAKMDPALKAIAEDPALTRTLGPSTQAGVVLGTFAYMPPEQAEGRPADARSDIYAFGAVLYEMITGRRAFPGGILRYRPTPLSELIPGSISQVQALIDRCLEVDPARRLQSAPELRSEIQRTLEAPRLPGAESAASIAVLPFANLSAEKENEYFSDGLSEEILNALTRLPGLRVTARTSSFAFRGRETDIREIGQALNVGAVLEGSVRKSGNRVRITAQLINVADGYHLWSDRFDREITDVFVVQDEIAGAIVAALKVKLGGRRAVPQASSNPEVYSLVLKARYHARKFTRDGIARARQYYEEALAMEPRCALAYDGLASLALMQSLAGVSAPAGVLRQAREAVERALALDPRLGEAHTTLGVLRAMGDYNWDGARAAFLRAQELNPSSWNAWGLYAMYYLRPKGRLSEAVEVCRRALELDPLSPQAMFTLAMMQYWNRQFAAARQNAEQALELDPTAWMPRMAIVLSLYHEGKEQEALEYGEQALAACPDVNLLKAIVAWVYGRCGRGEDARRMELELMEGSAVRYVPPFSVALAYLGAGDLDEAFTWLDRAVAERDSLLLVLPVEPAADSIRSDPRYARIMDRMNLA